MKALRVPLVVLIALIVPGGVLLVLPAVVRKWQDWRARRRSSSPESEDIRRQESPESCL